MATPLHAKLAVAERVEPQVSVVRRLIGRVQAREVAQFTAPRFLIEPFGITLLAYLERSVDEYLDELARFDQFARYLALGSKWRNESNDRNQVGFDKELCHLRDAANVLDWIGFSEAEIAIVSVSDIVAVEHECALAERMKLLFQIVGDG